MEEEQQKQDLTDSKLCNEQQTSVLRESTVCLCVCVEFLVCLLYYIYRAGLAEGKEGTPICHGEVSVYVHLCVCVCVCNFEYCVVCAGSS